MARGKRGNYSNSLLPVKNYDHRLNTGHTRGMVRQFGLSNNCHKQILVVWNVVEMHFLLKFYQLPVISHVIVEIFCTL